MNRRILGMMGLAALFALLPAACGGGDDGSDSGTDTPDVTDDAGDTTDVPVEPNPNDGVRADFVLDTLRIGDIAEGEGFNLDGRVTRAGDPLFPEDGPGGVDNQLGALLTALADAGLDVDANAEIEAGIADGSLLILLSHRDVDDWSDDPGLVYLYGYAGHDPDDDPTNNLTGDGELEADERSLEDLTDLESALINFQNGQLHDTTAADGVLQDGDFEAGPSLFQVDIPVEDSVLHLEVNGTQIVWDLDTAPTGEPAVDGRIINGLLGGYIYIRDAARALQQIDLSGASIDVETLRSILGGQADMDVIPEGFQAEACTESTVQTDCAPGQTCEADDDRGGALYCYEQDENLDAISLGLVFTGVSCRITGIYDDPEWPPPP